MLAAPLPADEQERLDRLRELAILDSEPEPLFDAIAATASQVCGVPIALVSLIDAERQWFKASFGLPDATETPRELAFCAHTILGDAIFEVPDATDDQRFADNPLVTGAPEIRFYAGAPLRLPGGERVGTLCVIDRRPNRLTDAQAQTLRSLAQVVSDALQMRRDLLDKALSVRSRYEQALSESEARYRAMVDEQREFVSLARADGTLVYVNTAYAHHFGATPAQMVGRSLYDFVDADDVEVVRARVAHVLPTGAVESGENRVRRADGSPRWVAWTNTRQVDSDGQPLLHSVGRDITDQRQAELALRDAQAFLARTGRAAGVGGWQMDLRSGQITWSEETHRIHDVGPDYQPELAAALDFYPPEARALVVAAVQRGRDEGEPWDLELPFITATGRRIWVRSVGEVEFENGEPVRLLGAFQDITRRHLLEQQLADSERFVRMITDSLPLRIAYVDRDGRYRFVNQAHALRFGVPIEQMLGKTRAELTSVEADAAVRPHREAVLEGRAQRFEYEETIAGELRRIESQLIPDVADSGEVRGFFVSGVDITERAANNQALRELTAIFDNTPDFVMQTDARGQVVYMNPAVRRALGLAHDAPVTELSFAQFNTAETQRRYVDTILPAVRAGGSWQGQSTVYLAGGREVAVSHSVIGHRDASGRITRYSAVMRDISDEVAAQQQLLQQSATLTAVAEALPVLVAVVGRDSRYRFVNSAFERAARRPRAEIVGRHAVDVLGAAAYEARRPWVERVLQGETLNFELSNVGPGPISNLAVSLVPLRLNDGTIDGFVAISQDITQHHQEKLHLRQLSQRDPLTGLLNRAGFEQALQQACGTEPQHTALLYVDLDHFKPVNDTHGHPVGDVLLRQFGQRLQALVRPSDAVARLGGDEFALLLCGVREAEHAERIADKVLKAAHVPFAVDALQLQIGASVGVAFGIDDAGWQGLVARADALLYEAKRAGRGRQAVGALPASRNPASRG